MRAVDRAAVKAVLALTGGVGVDTAIEAVGIPATFELYADIVAPGGTVANVGVHGCKADLHLERLWSHNITITTRLGDTAAIPQLLRAVLPGRPDASSLVSHRFRFSDILQAYSCFGDAAASGALKVLVTADHMT